MVAADRAADIGVSAAYGVLAVLDEFGPSSQADLGRRLGMDRRSTSEEAAALESGGLVFREPDPTDIRRNKLKISSAGLEVLGQLRVSYTLMQDELLAGLLLEERAQLTRLLAAIVAPDRSTKRGSKGV